MGEHSGARSAARSAETWKMQDSGTTAGLRGIDSVDGTIAWASGTGGTVLQTTDGGTLWHRCATPDGDKDGLTLDFRGVQAWDAQRAIVMASGPGDKSRLYKTTDGCRTWQLLLRNSDIDGFWDSFRFWDRENGLLLGDPTLTSSALVDDPAQGLASRLEFPVLFTVDGGTSWRRQRYAFPPPTPLEVVSRGDSAAFAASNTALALHEHNAWFVTGGKSGAAIYIGSQYGPAPPGVICDCAPMPPYTIWFTHRVSVPMTGGTESSGAFSVDFRDLKTGITVGGDFTKPNDSRGTAAFSTDGGEHWAAATKPPHGYRSAVQWSKELRAWITVGTNGSDISRDDGRTWQPLNNGNWNAVSLPFVVGPNGRIAKLNVAAIPK